MRIIFGSVLVIILIILAVSYVPDLITATDETIKDADTITANVTTGAAETTGTVTLTNALYNSATTEVTSITSTHGGDNPTPSSYSATSRVLTVSGLEASQTRTLTVIHNYDALANYTAAGPTARFGPTLFIMVLFIGLPAAIVMALFLRSRGA